MRRTAIIQKPPTPDQLRRGSRLPAPLPLARKPVVYRNGDAVEVDVPAPKKAKKKGDPEKARAAREYIKFSRELRAKYPVCQIRSPICSGKSQGVHHVIKLSQGGARMPGPLAEIQGQEFVSACNNCNARWVENYPADARRRGFLKSNPLRRPGLLEEKVTT